MPTTRTGILGGTFNPVHIGHLVLAQDAVEAFELAKVLFVPCFLPAHKPAQAVAPAARRVAMLEAALEGNPFFELCDIEVRRGGTSYSIDTLRMLKRAAPDVELVFIIGSDSLAELHTWKEIEEFPAFCRPAVAVRPGHDPENLSLEQLRLGRKMARQLLDNVFFGHQIDISSSDIRYRVAEGMSIRYLVPPAVEMYIAEHRLYGRL